MQVLIKVWLFQSPYTICYVSAKNIILQEMQHYKSIGINFKSCCENELEKVVSEPIKKKRFKVNALFLQPFVKECVISAVYRANMVKNLNELCGYSSNGTVYLRMILKPPDKEIIDYVWNEKLLRLIWTRVEIENAFSWLSTLGGAYSALGDYFEHCADEAGRISVRQYRLSKLLGDDSLAARSRLYSALAFAQKRQLKKSRHIVRSVAAFARETHDWRLNRMCQGVWAKLKYLRTNNYVNKCGSGDGKSDLNTGNGKVEINNVAIMRT